MSHAGAVVNTVTLQQECPEVGACVEFSCSLCFLPQSKDMAVGLIGGSILAAGVNISVLAI